MYTDDGIMESFDSSNFLFSTTEDDFSEESFVTDSAAETEILVQSLAEPTDEANGYIHPTFQISVIRDTAANGGNKEDGHGTTEGVQSLTSESASSMFTSTGLTSLNDIIQMASTVDKDVGSETTLNQHATTQQTTTQQTTTQQTTTQQGPHITEDDTSHERVFVTQERSHDMTEFVTNSLELAVSSTSHTDTTEERTESPSTITSTQFKSTFHELVSDPESINSTMVLTEDISTSPDHSESRLNDTEVSRQEMTLTSLPLISSPTDMTASSEKSSQVQLVLEATTIPLENYDQASATQVSSQVPLSTHYADQSSISTSTSEEKFQESTESTHLQKEPISTSISGQYVWKTSIAESTLQPRILSTEERLPVSSDTTLGDREPGTSAVVGYAVGATVAGLLLIAIVVIVLISKRRRKSCDISELESKDYRSLVKNPKRGPTTGGSAVPYTAFPSSPFPEIVESKDGPCSPYSATNFRARFDHDTTDSSVELKEFESPKDLPMKDLRKHSSSGNSESYSVNTFRPNSKKTTEIQSEKTNGV